MNKNIIYLKEKNELLIGLDINLLDSLIGFKMEFTHLDGEKYIIESDEILNKTILK